MSVEPKIGGFYPQNGWWVYHGSKPYVLMDDLGGFYHPYFWFNTHIVALNSSCKWFLSLLRVFRVLRRVFFGVDNLSWAWGGWGMWPSWLWTHVIFFAPLKDDTLPETFPPLKIGLNAPKGDSSSNHPFSGAMLVSGRVVVLVFMYFVFTGLLFCPICFLFVFSPTTSDINQPTNFGRIHQPLVCGFCSAPNRIFG